jgi:aryl carrier-like protein
VRASRAALPFLEKGAIHDHQHLVGLGIESLRAHARVWRREGAVIHYTRTQAATLGRQGHPRELRRARIDRVSRGIWEKRKADEPALYNQVSRRCRPSASGNPKRSRASCSSSPRRSPSG